MSEKAILKYKKFTFNDFYENTYVFWDSLTLEGVVFDPGCYQHYEFETLLKFIYDNRIQIKEVVNTHCHIDHVLGNEQITRKLNCPLVIGIHENETLQAVKLYAHLYGISGYAEKLPDKYLKEGDLLRIGTFALDVLEVPGHSKGHLAFYESENQFLISGDVLFRQSIGRTDLPGGNHPELIQSIKTKLFKLPDSATVFSGHGEETSIGYEKKYNPFLTD